MDGSRDERFHGYGFWDTGHGGKSGRWERLRENAEEAAFLVWQMGVADAK